MKSIRVQGLHHKVQRIHFIAVQGHLRQVGHKNQQDMLILLRSLIIDDWLNRAGKLETLLPEQPAFTLAEAADIIADTKPEWLQ